MDDILTQFYNDWLRVDAEVKGVGVTFIQVKAGNGDLLDCYHTGKEWAVKLRRAGSPARRMISGLSLYHTVREVLEAEYGPR